MKNEKNETAQVNEVETAKVKKIDLSKIENIKIAKSNNNSKELYKLNVSILSIDLQNRIKTEFKTENFNTLNYTTVNKVFNLKSYRSKIRNIKKYFLSNIKNVSDENLILQFLKFYKETFIINDFSVNSFSQSENANDYEKMLKICKDYLSKNKLSF